MAFLSYMGHKIGPPTFLFSVLLLPLFIAPSTLSTSVDRFIYRGLVPDTHYGLEHDGLGQEPGKHHRVLASGELDMQNIAISAEIY
jgi:hypothetical protein